MFRSPTNRLGVVATAVLTLGSVFLLSCGDDDNDSGTNPPVETEHVDFPLAVGHVWNFDRQSTKGLIAQVPYSMEITGTRNIDGQSYFTLVDVDDDSPTETYVRQSGHTIWVIPEEFLDGVVEEGDLVTAFVQEQSQGSFPWKYVDTDSPVNVPWTILNASGDIEVQGSTAKVTLTITGTHLGAQETTVPAGTFTTTRSRIEQNVQVSFLGQTFSIDSTQMLEIADGVGLVRIFETENDETEELIETEDSVLTSYTLAP